MLQFFLIYNCDYPYTEKNDIHKICVSKEFMYESGSNHKIFMNMFLLLLHKTHRHVLSYTYKQCNQIVYEIVVLFLELKLNFKYFSSAFFGFTYTQKQVNSTKVCINKFTKEDFLMEN